MSGLKVNKKIEVDEIELVKFQLITHCFVSDIHLNETELRILSLLGVTGEIRLIEFCRLAVEKGLLGSETAVNNCLSKIEKSKLFLKKGTGKKNIYLNPEIGVAFSKKDVVILNYLVFKKGDS